MLVFSVAKQITFSSGIFLCLAALPLAPMAARAADPGERAFSDARALFTQGRYSEALEAFTLVRATYPLVASKAQRMIGACHQWQGDYAQALAAYERLLTDYPASDAAREGHFWLGACYEARAQYAEALAEFHSQLASNPEVRAPETLHKLATRHRAMGERETADTYFTRLRTLNASSNRETARRAALLVGAYLREGSRWAEAAAHYAEIKQIYLEEAEDIEFQLAESQFAAWQLGPAMVSYQEWLNHFPSHARADYAKLRVEESMRNLGNTEEALEYLRRLAALGGAIEPDALLRQAEILGYWRNDTDAALNLADQIATRFAENKRMLGLVEFLKGFLYMRNHEGARARAHFQTMLDRYPDRNLSVEAATHIASTFYMEKDYARARELYLRAASDYECPVSGWKAHIRFLAADCLFRQRLGLRAVPEWRAVMQEFPGTDWAEEARRMIDMVEKDGFGR